MLVFTGSYGDDVLFSNGFTLVMFCFRGFYGNYVWFQGVVRRSQTCDR